MKLKGIMDTLGVKPGQVVSNPYARAFAPQPTVETIVVEEEGQDHEVSMAQNQLDSIIKAATELKSKIGEGEKDIPAWIQDHITNSENYINQAASNYHEYNTNESINEAFEVHYSDGIRAAKKFGNERQAIQFAKDLIKNKKGLQFVDVFNAGSGFHSTADTDAIVAWWGKGSYTDNKSKHDSKLASKKIKEEVVAEARLSDIVNSIVETPVIGKMIGSRVDEVVYNIGAGYMGNGLTIWNRAVKENGDYKIIAHIDPYGKISIRDKQMPAKIKSMIEDWAEAIKKGDK